jgi:hypothetical protein
MRAALFVVLVFVAGCGGKGGDTSGGSVDRPAAGDEPRVAHKPDRLRPSVNAGQLWLDYGDNQAKADEDYTGRRLTVGGDVHSVVKHGDGYEVRFTVLADEGPGNAAHGAVARFPASETGKVAKLKSLEMCYLQGRCLGLRAGGPRGYVVVLVDCKVIAEPKF